MAASANAIQVRSSAFEAGQRIPVQYTRGGKDVSPALSWSGVPAGTKELALIVEDPDAPRPVPWIHWVLYKLPADTRALPENVARSERLKDPTGALQGQNDFGSIGYNGPAPPKGHGVHHYHFRLYALDQPLNVEPGLEAKALRATMKGHVIAEGDWVGTYER